MFTRTQATWTWTGSGNGGISKFSWANHLSASEAGQALVKQAAFFNSLVTLLPTAVTVRHEGLVQIYDETLSTPGGGAQLVDQVTVASPPASVTGTGTGVWSAASGAWINWITPAFANGRRVVGRTFLVPLANTPTFQTDGTLALTAQNLIIGAGNSMNTNTPTHVVYYNRGGPSDPPKPTDKPHVAGWYASTGVTVPDKAGVLRSRRD